MTDTLARPEPPVEIDRATMGADTAKLARLPMRDLGIRFGFGAAVSVAAGIVGLALGQRIGGVLLAFPAILPAALTLIEKREGTSEAVSDVRGAVIGAIAMLLFAITVVALAGRIPTVLALLVAGAGWGAAGIGLYLLGSQLARALGEQQYLPGIGVIEAEPAVEALRRAGLRLGVAETDTGGALSALLVAALNGREVVSGGVVEPRQAEATEEAALALAADARRRFGAEVGIGVAGPLESGESAGLTWVAAAGPRRTRVARLVGDHGPENNRADAIRAALRLCREVGESR